jgi:hypothetical protein
LPAIRYQASVGGIPAALPIPAVTPEGATGGSSHVLGFPGTLAVPAPGPNILHVRKLAAAGYYGSTAASAIRPTKYMLVAPYPMVAPVARTRDRPAPVPAVSPKNVPVQLMRTPPRIAGTTVTNNPRPIVLWPIRGRPGRYA